MNFEKIAKIALASLSLAIAATFCGCSSCGKCAFDNFALYPAPVRRSTPTVIFDYPNYMARHQQGRTTRSELFGRQEWPITSVPTGYVTNGEIAGYREYTTDYQSVRSDNTPYQYYQQRTATYRAEQKYR